MTGEESKKRRFALWVNERKDPGFVRAEAIRAYLEKAGAECFYLSEETPRETIESAELILVLGGDGTMLRAAGTASLADRPLMGINMGTLGYLTEFSADQWQTAVDRLLAGEYGTEERMMLSGCLVGREGEELALNDISLTRSGTLRMLCYSVYVDGRLLADYRADGLLISTPTGSTGYNLSAGGPIVDPAARLMLITPVCAHSLNARSIVLPASALIEIQLGWGSEGEELEAAVDFDGQRRIPRFVSGDRLRIRAAERATRIIRTAERSFIETLHRKLAD